MRRILTDTQCAATRAHLLAKQEKEATKAFTLPPEKRTIKLTDGGGLYLEVPPNDQRGWRLTYRRPRHSPKAGKPNVISLGTYPEVTLSDARLRCDAARALIAQGIDPAEQKLEVARAAVAADAALFQKIATDWWAEVIAPHTSKDTQDRHKFNFDTLVDAFGKRAIGTIEPWELGELLKRRYQGGHTSDTRRTRAMASRIWCYAITEGHCKYDIAASFKRDRFKHKRKKMPAITDKFDETMLPAMEAAVGKLMADIRGYNDNRSPRMREMGLTRNALEMMALTIPRPHNVLGLKWSQILPDTTRPGRHLVLFTADEMKMDKPLRVPLSRQAEAILDAMRPYTGKGTFVFSTNGKPMGKNTLTRALSRLGYDTVKDHCAHGFRTVFGTLTTEWGGFSEDAIELSLAHRDEDQIRSIYTKAGMWDERCRLMQAYADNLDTLRGGGNIGAGDNVVPFKRTAA